MATQPVENIEAVLGRFQAWTGARTAVETKPGIREFSDEEALASGRYRWKSGSAAAAKPAKKTVAPPAPVAPSAAPARAKPTAAKVHKAKSGAAKRHHKGQAAASTAASAKSSAFQKEEKRPAFREVLAEAVRPAEVVVARPVELSRQVAISIRLAPSERALIKTRAAESGITASAYIRQCALEVEQLRAQVRAAVAAMDRGGPAPSLAPVSSPGFFARMARRFFPRSAPALALRA